MPLGGNPSLHPGASFPTANSSFEVSASAALQHPFGPDRSTISHCRGEGRFSAANTVRAHAAQHQFEYSCNSHGNAVGAGAPAGSAGNGVSGACSMSKKPRRHCAAWGVPGTGTEAERHAPRLSSVAGVEMLQSPGYSAVTAASVLRGPSPASGDGLALAPSSSLPGRGPARRCGRTNSTC